MARRRLDVLWALIRDQRRWTVQPPQPEQEADLDEPFTADWPQSGRTAYLRFISDDPYVVEVHDGTSTQIVVSVPLDTSEEWIAESRGRLAAARAALGVRAEDHRGARP